MGELKMSGHNYNHNMLTPEDLRMKAIESASRLLQGQGLGYVGEVVDRQLFELAEKIYKYIDTGEKPR